MKILIALVVVGALLFVADMTARNVAEGRAASFVQGELDLNEEPEVSLGGTPFLLKALGGSIPSVEVTSDRLVARGLELHDVAIEFSSIEASLGDLLSGDSNVVETTGGTGSAALSGEDLSRYLKRRGVPAEIMLIKGDLAVTTDQTGTQVGELSLEDGRLVINSVGLPRPLDIKLPGIAGGLVYEKVSIDGDNIVLEVSIPAGPLEAPAA